MRKRVTITIKEDILRQVDRIVDGLSIRSRSQAMEYLLSKTLSDYKIKNALVLAGGKELIKGVEEKSRFLLEINGKPLLEKVINHLEEFNAGKITVNVDSNKEKIINALNRKKISADFLELEKSSGTIEPLSRMKNQFTDTFIVVNGDTLSSINLNEMLSFHRTNKSIATIALTTVNNPRDYGVAMLQGEKITDFTEKPKKEAGSYLISAGYYIFEPEIFRYISRNMKSIEKDLFPRLVEKGLLIGYPFQGMYFNINTKKDFEKAKRIL
ncbi:MAG: sugar phosphate nucleotidyltransferase [archaeon]